MLLLRRLICLDGTLSFEPEGFGFFDIICSGGDALDVPEQKSRLKKIP